MGPPRKRQRMVPTTLYVSQRGVTVRRVGRLIRVEDEAGNCLARYSPYLLERVFLLGAVNVPTPTLHFLAQRSIPVALLSRTGKLVARIGPPDAGSPSLRRAQYASADDPVLQLENARAVVRAKLLGCKQLLRRHFRNYHLSELKEPIKALEELRRAALAAKTVQRIRGIEGRGAALYFRHFPDLLRVPLPFEARRRRPSPDPVNALLSFAYSLLAVEIENQLEAMGLDPRVGFLHVERAGRPALALDLMEEFRAEVADRLVKRCFNFRLLQESDFVNRASGQCWLKPEARGRFLQQYHALLEKPYRGPDGRMVTLRRVFHAQAREMVRSVREK